MSPCEAAICIAPWLKRYWRGMIVVAFTVLAAETGGTAWCYGLPQSPSVLLDGSGESSIINALAIAGPKHRRIHTSKHRNVTLPRLAAGTATAAAIVAIMRCCGNRGRSSSSMMGLLPSCTGLRSSAARSRVFLRRIEQRAAGSVGVAEKQAEGSVGVTEKSDPVPIILLTGFLGTGKTTLLKHWLEHANGRIGVVVNDVASVNIDAKLVGQQLRGGVNAKVDAVQLQNGCACCSLGEELLDTIDQLLLLQEGDEPFDQIVIELSGVAEPQRVRDNIAQARALGYSLGDAVELSQVVTVVDASSFCTDYMEWKIMMERPELVDDVQNEIGQQMVVQLLVEQVEGANVVILNKTDLATDEDLAATHEVVEALNTKAHLCQTSFGKVLLSDVLSSNDTHKHQMLQDDAHGHDGDSHATHGHDGHDNVVAGHEAHGHDVHGHEEEHTHGHEDSHEHTHQHGHEDSHEDSHAHGHSHSHSHSNTAETTAKQRFGISNITYRARRPFSADRLELALGSKWKVPEKDSVGEFLMVPTASMQDMPLNKVLRSKGYCWLDTHPSMRMFWSQAGKHMELKLDDYWWGATAENQRDFMEQIQPGEYERVQKEEWDKDWGDRRQELVFIGQSLDEKGIFETLNDCLLTDEELEEYRVDQQADMDKQHKAWQMYYSAE